MSPVDDVDVDVDAADATVGALLALALVSGRGWLSAAAAGWGAAGLLTPLLPPTELPISASERFLESSSVAELPWPLLLA